MTGQLPPTTRQPTSEEELQAAWIGGPDLHNAPITLVDYDPAWPGLFEREDRRIRAALGDRVVRLEHTGSTSMPGLAAKPVIDMTLIVPDSSDEDSYVPDLEAVGYVLRIREPDWHEHRVFKGPTRTSTSTSFRRTRRNSSGWSAFATGSGRTTRIATSTNERSVSWLPGNGSTSSTMRTRRRRWSKRSSRGRGFRAAGRVERRRPVASHSCQIPTGVVLRTSRVALCNLERSAAFRLSVRGHPSHRNGGRTARSPHLSPPGLVNVNFEGGARQPSVGRRSGMRVDSGAAARYRPRTPMKRFYFRRPA
jgi:GrpB-like predicted nucleotidyltransferase (UPF0157 family)